eukprot:Skav234567  [mRNA]  locus=scaffold2869:117201:117737:+ [translate_table: standard]
MGTLCSAYEEQEEFAINAHGEVAGQEKIQTPMFAPEEKLIYAAPVQWKPAMHFCQAPSKKVAEKMEVTHRPGTEANHNLTLPALLQTRHLFGSGNRPCKPTERQRGRCGPSLGEQFGHGESQEWLKAEEGRDELTMEPRFRLKRVERGKECSNERRAAPARLDRIPMRRIRTCRICCR